MIRGGDYTVVDSGTSRDCRTLSVPLPSAVG